MSDLEKEHLRQAMARRMQAYLQGGACACVSAHVETELRECDLCNREHAQQFFILKNRVHKKWLVEPKCLLDMVRFQVVDVPDIERWVEKLRQLQQLEEARLKQLEHEAQERRRRHESKVIVRRKGPPTGVVPPDTRNR